MGEIDDGYDEETELLMSREIQIHQTRPQEHSHFDKQLDSFTFITSNMFQMLSNIRYLYLQHSYRRYIATSSPSGREDPS